MQESIFYFVTFADSKNLFNAYRFENKTFETLGEANDFKTVLTLFHGGAHNLKIIKMTEKAEEVSP